MSIFVIESSAPAEANRYQHMCKLENVELVEKQQFQVSEEPLSSFEQCSTSLFSNKPSS